MASGYEKINKVKGFLKSKVTVNQLANLLNCGPRTVFRHLEVVVLVVAPTIQSELLDNCQTLYDV